MTTSYDTSQDPAGVTTQTFYDGYGTENIVQTYNIVGGQTPIDVNPTSLPGGEYTVNLNIPRLVSNGPNTGYVTDPNSGAVQYSFSLQYGQGTASLIENSAATGLTSTIATVHDVATMIINGQWEPVQGFINISILGANGFDIDTGPKILTDQTGGTTANQSLSLSGNVVHYLPSEMFNFADGEVVNIFDNGVQVGSSTIQSVNVPGTQRYLGSNDTAWDTSFNLTPGDNAVTITTTDRNGLSGTASLDYVYTPTGGTTAGSSGSPPPSGQTGTGSNGTVAAPPPPPPVDAVSIDPNVTFLGHGAFQVTGHALSTAGVNHVELTADVDGVATDLGTAAVNPDGSFVFTDQVGAHSQSFIAAALTDGVGQALSANSGFNLQAGITGAPYVAEQDVYDQTTGDIVSSSLFHKDGSRTVQVNEPDLTLVSAAADIFLNGGQPDNTFVFQAGYGADVIRGFRATGDGHDTISLPASDFGSIAAILSHTQQTQGGAVIHDPASGDTLQLAGISKAQLAHNRGDFSLHA